LLNEISSIQGVRDIIITAASNSLKCLIDMPLFEQYRFEQTALEIDGVIYSGLDLNNSPLNGLNLSNETINTYFCIEFTPSGQTIPQNEIAEYKVKSGNNTPFVAGAMIHSDNEVMLSDYVLARYGVAASQELLNKDIVFHVPTSDGLRPFSQKFTLRGIIDSGFWNIESRIMQAQIIISSTNTDTEWGYNYTIFPQTFNDAPAVIAEIERLTGECPAYLFMSQNVYSTLELQRNLINSVLLIIGVVVLVAVITYTANIYTHYITEKRFSFGVLRSVGITTEDLTIIIFSELAFAVAVSFLSVVVLVAVASSAFYSYLYNLLGVSLQLRAAGYFLHSILTLILSMVMVFTFTKTAVSRIKNCGIVNLLK
jgi:ABC-type lipoprotein release transport system permease subunit